MSPVFCDHVSCPLHPILSYLLSPVPCLQYFLLSPASYTVSCPLPPILSTVPCLLYCLMSPASYTVDPVPCLIYCLLSLASYPVSCPCRLYCPLSPVSWLLMSVSCLLSCVSCPLSPVPVSCPLSPVPCHLPPFSCPLSPVFGPISYASYQKSSVPCLLSHDPSLLFLVFYLLSRPLSSVRSLLFPISYHFSPVYFQVSLIPCLMSPVSGPLSPVFGPLFFLSLSISQIYLWVSTSNILHSLHSLYSIQLEVSRPFSLLKIPVW